MASTIDTIIMYLGISVKLGVNPALSIFGLFANVINIAVFLKLGLSDGVNCSFFILSVWDGVFALIAFIYGATYISNYALRTIANSRIAELNAQLVFLVTYFAYGSLQTLSITTTVVIAIVRCCCVALPFKVKDILTTKRQLLAIFAFPLVPISLYIYSYSSVRVVIAKNPLTNQTFLQFPGANKVLYSTTRNTIVVGGFIILTLCAIILSVFLKRSSKFRETSTGGHDGAFSNAKSAESLRDARITKAFVLICLCAAICNMPPMIYRILYLSISDFLTNPKFQIAEDLILILGETLNLINVVVNIFIYYFTNVRFRQQFWKYLGRSNKS